METSPLIFAQPAWFYALLIVPVVAGLYIWSHRRSKTLIGKIVAPRLRSQLAGAVSVKLRATKAILVLLAFALMVVTLAQPQKGYIQTEVKQTGRDIVIAIDTSRSMLATDVSPTRLARAKLVAQDLMRLAHGDRMGVIAFAGAAFLQAPLTVDYGAVLNTLNELDTNIIPKGGTNIAAAINLAVDAFGKGEGQNRALIILTDGEELDADGVAAAKKASEAGIHVFTIGIGSAEGSLIPLPKDGGGVNFVQDASGKSVTSRLDETRLKEIAAAGHGFYEPIGPEVAKSVFDKGIVPMAQTERQMETSRRPIEKFQIPLSGAIALLALWLVLGERRRASSIRRAAAGAALFFLSTGISHAANGYEDYQAGQYDKAMSDFEQRLKAQPNSEQLQFDAGVAAYKLGDYGKAVDYFTKGLLAQDKKIREDASYNLGNALVRRGEAAKGKDEKKSDWKNAIQHYSEALNVDAKNVQAKENRDIVKKLLEDLEKQEKQQQDQKKDDKQQDKKDQKQDQKDQQNQQGQQDQKDQKQDSKDQQKQDQKNDQNKQGQDQKNQQDQKGQQDQKNQQDKQGQQGNDKKDGQDQQKKDQPEQKKGDQDKQGQNQKQDQKDQGQPKDQNQQQQGQGDKDKQDQAKNEPKNSGKPLDQQGGAQPTPQPTPAGEKKQGEVKAAQEKDQAQEDKQGEAAQAVQESKDGEMTAAQAKSLLNSLRSEEAPVQKMQKPQIDDVLKDW